MVPNHTSFQQTSFGEVNLVEEFWVFIEIEIDR